MSDLALIDGDPAPGSPAQVRFLAKQIGRTGGRAHEARLALDGVGSDLSACVWEGESADGFAAAFDPVPGDLGLMAEAYDLVAGALDRYAAELEQIQQSVQQALTRARLAKQREQIAAPRRDAAAGRVAALRRQLGVLSAEERARAVQVTVSVVDPAVHASAQQALADVRQTRTSVERALWGAQDERASAQRELDEAAGELRSAKVWAQSLRSERAAAEQRTVAVIEGALAISLRNRSNFDRLAGWVDGYVDNVRDGVGDVVHAVKDAGFFGVVAELRTALDTLDIIVYIALIVVVVASAIAIMTGVGAPAGLVLLATCLKTASTVITGTKLVTSVVLAGAQYRDPETKKPVVGWAGVLWDGVSFAASKGTGTTLGHFKRAGWAEDARHATGVWRKFHVASKTGLDVWGVSKNPVRIALNHAAKGIVQVLDEGKKYYERGKVIIDLMTARQRNGAAVPTAGACYAN